MDKEEIIKAFLAGVSVTSEGFNAEYAGGNDPDIEKRFGKLAEKYAQMRIGDRAKLLDKIEKIQHSYSATKGQNEYDLLVREDVADLFESYAQMFIEKQGDKDLTSAYLLGHFDGKKDKEEQTKQSEWISVDDRLPEFDKPVLARFIGWDDMEFMRVLELEYNAGWVDWESNDYNTVTHWMPLPTSPNNKD